MKSGIRFGGTALMAWAFSAACASPGDLEQAREARHGHDRCVSVYGADSERCRALEEEAKAAERHYEGDLQTPLNCDPNFLECAGGP